MTWLPPHMCRITPCLGFAVFRELSTAGFSAHEPLQSGSQSVRWVPSDCQHMIPLQSGNRCVSACELDIICL
ncbi:hypothetical protein BC827DRAFT_1233627 [Russula dissimulans]|nr:hypothetical protein BC827DRAFT_1233627 [Russula dissimulans]